MKRLSSLYKTGAKRYFSLKQPHGTDFFSERRFGDLDWLREDLKAICTQKSYNYLTKAQNQSIDNIVKNQNNLVLAETGSGKTLLYLLPILNHIYNKHQGIDKGETKGAIIFTSNKELTAQIYLHLKELDVIDKVNVKRLGSLDQVSKTIDEVS